MIILTYNKSDYSDGSGAIKVINEYYADYESARMAEKNYSGKKDRTNIRLLVDYSRLQALENYNTLLLRLIESHTNIPTSDLELKIKG